MLTLPDLLCHTAAAYPQRPAIRDDAGGYNWSRFVDRVARRARLLQQVGLCPGDHFATLCRNSAVHAEFIMGGYWSGIVPIPLNYRLTGVDIAWMLDNSRCHRILVDESLLYLLDQPALASWRDRTVCVGRQGAGGGMIASEPLMAALRPAPPHPVREDDTALHLYTSGTTGRGKGVRLSHRNIVANAMQLARVMAPTPDDVYLHVSPMFHSTDLKATVVSMFGGSHVYMEDTSPTRVLNAMARHGVTIASVLPGLLARLVQTAPSCDARLDRLRLISYGTSSLDVSLLRQAAATFPQAGFHQCYGLTETSPYIAIMDEDTHRRALTDQPQWLKATGRILPGTTIRLIDEHDMEVGPGETGEIVVTGPQVAQGYVNLPDEQQALFRHGAFHTGDIGRIDEHGLLYIMDRKHEVVVSEGTRIYTIEIEAVLQQCPGVLEAAVIGVPHTPSGGALLAVVVHTPGHNPSTSDIMAFCADRLSADRVPRLFLFVERLPRTPHGKIRKQELREAYEASMQLA